MLKVKTLFRQLALMACYMGVRFTAKYIISILLNVCQVIKSGSLGVVDLKNTTPIIINYGDKKFRFNPETISTVREIYLNNCYQFNVKKYYANVLDLGANTGVFSILASKRAEHVFSVECNKSGMSDQFNHHVVQNKAYNCTFINKFISNISVGDRISVNEIVSEYSISELSFVKIDIEGAEKELFLSNLDWLRITMAISMEVHPCFGVDECGLISILNDNGFHTILLDKNMRNVNKLSHNGMGYIRAFK